MDSLDPLKSPIHSGTEIVAKKKAEYRFLGAGRRPHRNMFLYALDKEKGEVYHIPVVPKEEIMFPKNPKGKEKMHSTARVNLNANHPAVWKINAKNALKYFEKRYNRKFKINKEYNG